MSTESLPTVSVCASVKCYQQFDSKCRIYVVNVVLAFLFVICGVLTKSYLVDDGDHDLPGDSGLLSANCMRCICNAVGCVKGMECRGGVCGPYNLTLQYWEDAFDRNDVSEYHLCTKHVWCAYRTVQKYMTRYLPQCVRLSEGRSVCETALALQLHGREYCSHALTTYQRNRLHECRDRYVWSWLDLDSTADRALDRF